MKKSISIQALIYRNYLRSSLIPIFTIEVLLLVLYFAINSYTSDKNQQVLLQEVTRNLQEITSRESININYRLQEVSSYAALIRREHQAFFANPDSCFLPHGEAQFTTHKNGAYYKVNKTGASLYYSSHTPIGEAEKRKARCSERLDPLLVSIVKTSPIITQAYLNTQDGMNRIYPFMDNAPEQYGPVLHMQEFNFYYAADGEHNPQRKSVWTEVYLDPAGQGWMISHVFPIYNGDFLEGVSGLDVTIASFIENILNLNIPWQASTFMVDHNGGILAMQEKIEQLIGLKELKNHVYNENIQSTVKKPDGYNLFRAQANTFKTQIKGIFKTQQRISRISIDDTHYLISQEIIPETGWRMFTVIEEAVIFSAINTLKQVSRVIGYFAIALMLLFYIIFFLFLLHKSKTLTAKIATPIEKLSRLTGGLGENLKTEKLCAVGITEVDDLSHNFNTMISELDARNDALVDAQLREKIRQRESEILERHALTDSLTNLYNRRKLDEALTVENERAQRFGHPYGIILLDIDNFKRINDNYGHQEGDQVLIAIAKLLQQQTRKTDIIGRWGGEEFLVICPQTDKNGLLQLAEKLRKSIAQCQLSAAGYQTSSFGLSLYRQGDENKDIIARADQALYRAKKHGKNRCELQ